MDYRTQRAVIAVDIDVSGACDVAGAVSKYRSARLRFMDAGERQPRTSILGLPPIHEDRFLCWLFVKQSNKFQSNMRSRRRIGWVDRGMSRARLCGWLK